MSPNYLKYLCLCLLIQSCTGNPDSSREIKDSVSGALDTIRSGRKPKGYIPNELGKVMVLEYHLIGQPEDTWRRTPENFRKDLQLLYDHNFYPVSVLDLAKRKLDIPAGMTPFALTFDDSSAGQFRYIEKMVAWRSILTVQLVLWKLLKRSTPIFR